MRQKFLILDTFNFLHRAYHALPQTLTDSAGNPTNAQYGLAAMVISIFGVLKPDYALAALDSKKPTFRSEEFTGYKAQRRPMESTLAVQIQPAIDLLDAFGIKTLTVDGYEADDIIGTATQNLKQDKNIDVIIASNDRDLWQLVDTNVFIILPSGKGEVDWLGVNEVTNRLGFNPERLVDYKALRGDPGDNIPGVYGIGEKTAKKLLAEYTTVEQVYANLQTIMPLSLRKKLEESYEQAMLSKKLAAIITDVPVDMRTKTFVYSGYNQQRVQEEFEKRNFVSLLKKLGFGVGGVKTESGLYEQKSLF